MTSIKGLHNSRESHIWTDNGTTLDNTELNWATRFECTPLSLLFASVDDPYSTLLLLATLFLYFYGILSLSA